MFRHAGARIQSYLRHHVRGMQRNMRPVPGQAATDVRFLLYVLLLAVVVIAVAWLGTFKSTIFLTQVIDEGMGSISLMGFFCSLAVSLFGAALLAPRFGALVRAAHNMLRSTFGMSVLSYGLLLGFCIVSAETFTTMQIVLLAVGFLLVGILKFAILYLSWLCSPESQRYGFFAWWCGEPLPFRALVALPILIAPIAFLLAES